MPHIELNPAQRARVTSTPERTIIVLGAPQSGTSVAAGVLWHLGVYMGAALTQHYEDWAFAVTLPGGVKPRALLTRRMLLEHLAGTIRCRNATHEVWGWKRPGECRYLDGLERELRNPAFLVATRRLLDGAFSAERHRGARPDRALLTCARQQHGILSYLAEQRHPALVFDFDAALRDREEFVESVCDFFGLKPTPTEREGALQFLSPAHGYREPDNAGIEGFIDAVDSARVTGWASDQRRPDEPVEVRLLLGGAPVATTTAALERADVKAAGLHPSGRCGFCFELAMGRRIQVGQEVRVIAGPSGADLRKSAVPYRPRLWPHLAYGS